MNTQMTEMVETIDNASYWSKLGNFVQYYQVEIPKSHTNIPTALINPSLLATVLNSCMDPDDIPEDNLIDATVEVEYHEGFPTIDGIPIWERIEGERIQHYNLFKEYRQLKEQKGTRSLVLMKQSYEFIPYQVFNALAKAYHWGVRVKAYDSYNDYLIEQERRVLRDQLEIKHSQVANNLVDQAAKYLDENPEQLNPKVAVQMIQLGIKAGRLSLGMMPDKPELSAEARKQAEKAVPFNLQINNNVEATAEGAKQSVESKLDARLSEDVFMQEMLDVFNVGGAVDPTLFGADRIEANIDGNIEEFEPQENGDDEVIDVASKEE